MGSIRVRESTQKLFFDFHYKETSYVVRLIALSPLSLSARHGSPFW